MQSMTENMEIYKQARAEEYPDGTLTYEEAGNTAYITFDAFDMQANTYEDYYSYENKQDIPFKDTIACYFPALEHIW